MFPSRSTPSLITPRRAASAAAFALVALLAGCGGGGGGGGHPAPLPSPPPPVELGPLYDFTPIGLPGSTFGEVGPKGIANGGLVAGTSFAPGSARAFFYNGKTNIDLGDFGGNGSRAFAVNRCGQVAGWGQTGSGAAHAFFYNGTLHDLGTLGGRESWASAISTCGKVAGWSLTGTNEQHAFYHDGKTMRDLGTFGGTRSEATGVNSVGQVAGYAFGPGNAWYHAFLYDARTGAPIQDLGVPVLNSDAIDINDAGQVAVNTRDAEGRLRAFRYEAGASHDLGLPPGGPDSWARAMNAAGHIVGYVFYPDRRQIAFLHDGTTMRELGTLGGSRFSDAFAINGAGLVVGASFDPATNSEHAIAWSAAYGMVDLNARVKDLPAGLVLLRALAVADDGAIAVRTNQGLGLLRPRR